MSAIRLLERSKGWLLLVLAVGLALFIGELQYLSRAGEVTLQRTESLLVLLPPLAVWASFFPLCYYYWFRNPEKDGPRRGWKIWFWVLALGSSLIWLNIVFTTLQASS